MNHDATVNYDSAEDRRMAESTWELVKASAINWSWSSAGHAVTDNEPTSWLSRELQRCHTVWHKCHVASHNMTTSIAHVLSHSTTSMSHIMSHTRRHQCHVISHNMTSVSLIVSHTTTSVSCNVTQCDINLTCCVTQYDVGVIHYVAHNLWHQRHAMSHNTT